MSGNIGFKSVGSVSAEEYHKAVLTLMDQKLVQYVQKEWTHEIWSDNIRKNYPIRTTINEIERRAAELKRIENSKEITGWVLPGCDIIKIGNQSGGSSVSGWRVNILRENPQAGEETVVNLSVFGERVPLLSDRNMQRDKQRRVHLPMFRKVTVIAEEREWQERESKASHVGLTLLYIKQVHGKEPIPMKDLVSRLLKAPDAIDVSALTKNMVYKTLIVTGAIWRTANPLDEWVDSEEDMLKVERIDPNTGKQASRINPVSGRPELLWDMVPRRVRSQTGQPFIQTRMSDNENEKPEEIWTTKLTISPAGNDEDDKGQNVSVVFSNYQYGKPMMFMPGWEVILKSARKRGNTMDSDPRKNPFTELNNSYRGQKIVCVVNFSKWNDYKNQTTGEKTAYLTLVPGMVLCEDADQMEDTDKKFPDFPSSIPAELVTGGVSSSAPVPTPTPVKKEVSKVSREQELSAMNVKDLRDILQSYADKGYEVHINGKKINLVKEILKVENGEIKAPEKTIPKTEPAKTDDKAQAGGKAVLMTTPVQAEAVKETEKKDAPKQDTPVPQTVSEDPRIAELNESLKEFIATYPDSTFESLYGNNNDLEVFPAWVTPQHKDLVDQLIKKLKGA